MNDIGCQRCGHTHSSADAIAINRFSGGQTLYVAAHVGAPVRMTRAEAEQDACEYRERQTAIAMSATHLPRDVRQCHDERAEPGPFPAALMETSARERAWMRFLSEVTFSMRVWQLDEQVRAGCQDVRTWVRRCGNDLIEMAA